jgi:beta-lactamase class A
LSSALSPARAAPACPAPRYEKEMAGFLAQVRALSPEQAAKTLDALSNDSSDDGYAAHLGLASLLKLRSQGAMPAQGVYCDVAGRWIGVTTEDHRDFTLDLTKADAHGAVDLAQLREGPAPDSARTAKQIDDFLNDLSKKTDLSAFHISIVDLRDAAKAGRAGWHDTEIVPAASVIKLAVLAYAYHAAQTGALDWSQTVLIDPKNVVATWGPTPDPYPAIAAGARWSVRDLVKVMVRRSDNCATDTLIDLFGREKITAFAHEIGCAQTLLRHKLNDDNDPQATGLNQMPPHDAAVLLEAVARRNLVSPQASQDMLETLGEQMDRYLIAQILPPGAVYAGKTGQLSHNRNDAAIVRGPGRSYVLVIYTSLTDNDDSTSPAADQIRAAAKALDAFLSR